MREKNCQWHREVTVLEDEQKWMGERRPPPPQEEDGEEAGQQSRVKWSLNCDGGRKAESMGRLQQAGRMAWGQESKLWGDRLGSSPLSVD